MNCLKTSLVGVYAGAVAARAGAAEAGGAEVEPGAREPQSVLETVKPLDSVNLLEPLGVDLLDVAGADALAAP